LAPPDRAGRAAADAEGRPVQPEHLVRRRHRGSVERLQRVLRGGAVHELDEAVPFAEARLLVSNDLHAADRACYFVGESGVWSVLAKNILSREKKATFGFASCIC
jgi:hypothetical protein